MGEARLQRVLCSRSVPQPCGSTEMKGPSSPSSPSSLHPAFVECSRSEQVSTYPYLSYSRCSGLLHRSLSTGHRARKPNQGLDGRGGGVRGRHRTTKGPSRARRLSPLRCGIDADGPDVSPKRGSSWERLSGGPRPRTELIPHLEPLLVQKAKQSKREEGREIGALAHGRLLLSGARVAVLAWGSAPGQLPSS